MSYVCPVCNFGGLVAPPADWYICPCCGTEFCNDDAYKTHAELRAQWLDRGAPWFSSATPPPSNWDPIDQLMQARTPPQDSGDQVVDVPFEHRPATVLPSAMTAGEAKRYVQSR